MRTIRMLAVALAATLALPAAAQTPAWREDATRLYYDLELHLPWTNSLGDWVDAAGAKQGSKPFATASVASGATEVPVRFDVTQLVRAHGGDFRVNAEGGAAIFASREAAAGKPVLRVTKGGQTRVLEAAADVSMDSSTVQPLGERDHLSTKGGFMIRFAQPADAGIERAELVLTSTRRRGPTRLVVFRPAPSIDTPDLARNALAPTPDSNFPAKRIREAPTPESTYPAKRIAAAAAPRGRAAARGGPARIIKQWTGADIKPRRYNKIEGDIATAWIENDSIMFIPDIFELPGARTEAYLTVVMRLHEDWRATGGKFPGLSNTGQLQDPTETCVIDGVPAKRGGWGGRRANGCRWSARTGFWGQREGRIGAGTYYYATTPRSLNGVVHYWPLTFPKGKWFAYVQRVKLNDPGRANGVLAHWLIDDGAARGGRAVQAKDDIVWRTTDQPASAINEVWANVYCGGVACGKAPWPRSTVSLKRLTVTDALPDMAAIQAELDRMNRG